MNKQLLLIFTFLISTNLFAGSYYFKFNLGIGTSNANEVLIYYQITDKNGSKGHLTPYSIRNLNSIKLLKIKLKKRKTKFINFEGFIIEADGTKKPILKLQSKIENIKTGKSNFTLLDLNAVIPRNIAPKPITEFISEIERKNYLSILKKEKDKAFNYNNFFPLGKFILYDPIGKKSLDAITVKTNSPEFIESSKGIKDHYFLRKKAGGNLDVKYTKLFSTSLNSSKQQYIEYLIEIKKMQVLHWQSDKSEAEYLYERYEKNNLGILANSFESNPNYKLYFVSSCVKINDFKIATAVHDSISTVAKVNVNISAANNPFITVNGGVIYSRDEVASTKDSTQVYYTGFRVRDYTDYVKGLILNLDLTNKLDKTKSKFNNQRQNVISNFKNLREIDNSFIEFKSASAIARFFENIAPKEFTINEELSDDLNKIEKIKIDSYNTLLDELKESIIEYKNIKNYLKSLETADINDSQIIKTNPKEKRIEDEVIESIANQ
ncbi:hypothetical protein [Tenacibaculum aiptasiae]|uniref:hypothetical protein n=1 Tax=Tenacibaculum aiptasiae TaxID=426481 RepID=UPI003B58E9BB